ncbi:MAG: sugar ABC transporter ATP-binding protein [Clostridia bacterium]|nr:sugar ABC transporter ATP-binding protein [Clostridia bacterium]
MVSSVRERKNGEVLLTVSDMTKTFGPVTALKNVGMTLKRGDVLGLIGENGSGKSTVSSIIAGMQTADSGNMTFLGEKWEPQSMLDALENGVGMIVQESGTIAGVSVAENIFLGELSQFSKFGIVNRKNLNEAANSVLRNIGVENVTGEMPMAALDFQARKLIEIAKVVMKEPEILIVDETTTALSQHGREVLYKIIDRYRAENRAVIFISHDLDEILEVCDTLTVLRDGNMIRTFEKSEFDADDIRTSMIGREMQGDYYRSDFVPTREDEIALKVDNVVVSGHVNGVSVEVHRGEILGIGGLSHCGMHTLGKVMFGAVAPDSGKVVLSDGTEVKNEFVAMKKMLGYVSKDRDNESLILSASVKDNIAVAGMEKYAVNNFIILDGREKKYVDGQIDSLSIKCSSRNQAVQTLSGGNKQKVVFGKWVGRGSEILILDCPTRGVDIGVKQAMYQLMVKLKGEGKSIVMISEELPELIGMSDRLVIMKDGKVTKEFQRSKDLSDAEIIKYMI